MTKQPMIEHTLHHRPPLPPSSRPPPSIPDHHLIRRRSRPHQPGISGTLSCQLREGRWARRNGKKTTTDSEVAATATTTAQSVAAATSVATATAISELAMVVSANSKDLVEIIQELDDYFIKASTARAPL